MESARKRYTWVDCLKAILIFSIVFQHVNQLCFCYIPNFYVSFITSYNLQVFFFLSGMFISTKNDKAKFFRSLAALLIPFLVLGTLFTCCVAKVPLYTLFVGHMHNGYWFIWTLMVLRILFFVRNVIVGQFQNTRCRVIAADVAIMTTVIVTSLIAVRLFSPSVCAFFSLDMLRVCVVSYFAGHWYNEYCLKQGLDIPGFMVECLLLAFIAALVTAECVTSPVIAQLMRPIYSLCGVLVTVSLVKKLPETILDNSFAQFIGKRTLEIYVCHYFLLPFGIYTYLMPITELGDGASCLLYVLIAILIIAFICPLLWILQQFPTFYFVLFGKFPSRQ